MPKKQAAPKLQEDPVVSDDTPEDNPQATAPADPTEGMPFDKIVRIYRKIGNAVTELEAEYEAKLKELKDQQEVFKTAIREHMKLQNATSINTPHGLAVMSVRTRYSTTDWDSFKEFVKKHDALDLFEKRIAQGNMATFLKAHPELVPSGLNSDSTYEISVRKPKVSPTK